MTNKNLLYYDLRAEQKRKAELEYGQMGQKKAKSIDFMLGRTPVVEQPAPSYIRANLDDDQVAERTRVALANRAEIYYRQLRDWREDLNFERFEWVKILDQLSHLGYAAITRGIWPDKDGSFIPWVFYFSNFNARFGKGDTLFDNLPKKYGVTFFCLALTVDGERKVNGRDSSKRGNGVLFSTKDPAVAMANVAKLKVAQINFNFLNNAFRQLV